MMPGDIIETSYPGEKEDHRAKVVKPAKGVTNAWEIEFISGPHDGERAFFADTVE